MKVKSTDLKFFPKCIFAFRRKDKYMKEKKLYETTFYETLSFFFAKYSIMVCNFFRY